MIENNLDNFKNNISCNKLTTYDLFMIQSNLWLCFGNSDCSIASGGSLSKHAIYHDATQAATRVPTPQIHQDPPSQIQMQQQPSDHPPHFIPTTHYIQHTPMPVSSYYPMYLHHQTQHTDQQYPMYLLHQTQPSYDASSRPLTPPLPPAYPAKPADMHQMVVQVPAQQFQQHYIGLQQMPSPSITNAAAAAATTAAAAAGGNYGYEYSHHLQDQAYYAASSAPPPLPQYQTMTPATAVMFSQASTQIPSENNPPQSWWWRINMEKMKFN